MKNRQEKIEEARARAYALYVKNQFVCSEAVLYAINGILGAPLPAEIVRIASGFAGGIGKSGYICGALTGGVMTLGLALGRTEPGAGCPKLMPATKELLDWFERTFGSSCCAVLTKDRKILSGKKSDPCTVMTGDTAAKAMELILKYERMSSGRALLHRVHHALGGS
jgi:C_GCAxxG_C_C family probable redox protein